jgi:hypothetical protein
VIPEKGSVTATMPRSMFSGYRDRLRSPRFIIKLGVVSLVIVAFLAVALSVASTRWFCGNVCHAVQDDTIAAYQRSSHSNISCLACHMPVSADPVTFLLHKIDLGFGGTVRTVSGTFELPMNAESELAMDPVKMPEGQCTQCHSKNRIVSTSPGILINHAIHSAKDVRCTECHNRVAHNEEGMTLTLKGNKKHEDFMKMEGCFRCHDLAKKKRAGGECRLCHPAGFELKPKNHFEAAFYTHFGDSKGHAKLAKEDTSDRYCSMCHVKSTFCDGCHGVPMPHPAGFAKGHGDVGKKSPKACSNCHAKGTATAKGTEFCNACHHKAGDPSKPWLPQHFQVVRTGDPNECFACHKTSFCADCHVRGFGVR